jgi:hypothetical protein
MESVDYFLHIKVSNIGEISGIIAINPLLIDCFYNSGVCELKMLIHLPENV